MVDETSHHLKRVHRRLLITTAPISDDHGVSSNPPDDADVPISNDHGATSSFPHDADVAQSGKVARCRRHRTQTWTQRPPDYLGRRQLLALVPLSMSTIDALEKKRAFPSRFVLSPTVKVCWRRHEVEKWLSERARKRVHQAAENDRFHRREKKGIHAGGHPDCSRQSRDVGE
jgi:prophage regulatory protein